MVCPHGQGGQGVKPVRTFSGQGGRGSQLKNFAILADVFYGRSLKLLSTWGSLLQGALQAGHWVPAWACTVLLNMMEERLTKLLIKAHMIAY